MSAENIQKSLDDLESLADSLLKKSEPSEPAEDKEEKVAPEDIVDSKEKDSNEPEDKEEKEDKEEDPEDDIEKSIVNESFDKEEIQKSIEVSEFLAALTEANTEALIGLGEVFKKSLQDMQEKFLSKELVKSEPLQVMEGFDFAKSFGILAQAQSTIIQSQQSFETLIKSVGEQLTDLSSRMEQIESQPNMRKSFGSINTRPKDFFKSISAEGGNPLSKSQICTALTDMMIKGDRDVSQQDIISVESGAPLRRELQEKVSSYYSG